MEPLTSIQRQTQEFGDVPLRGRRSNVQGFGPGELLRPCRALPALDVGLSTPHFSRRDLLRVAGLLGLSFLLPPLEARAAKERGKSRKKSLITIFLEGGASQLETWDPHPGTKIGGPTKAIDTAIRGLKVADTFPQIAAEIGSLSVIRSLVSKEGDHERGSYLLKTGYRPDPTLWHPTFGAILSHELPEAGVEIPRYVSLGAAQWPGWGGFLGAQFDAFKIYDPHQNLYNLERQVSESR